MPPHLMQIDKLAKSYSKEMVLDNISLTFDKGEVAGVIGPSGAGKSTLVRCLNGLEKIDSGEIYFDGIPLTRKETDLDRLRMRIGFVFQDFNLFPHMTVQNNVMVGLRKVKRIKRGEAAEIAHGELERVGLADKLHAYPAELSGGQQQRASIARALAMQPEIMLFDEPTSALDPESVGGVLNVMRDLVKSGMTMVIVSHEMAFIEAVADKVIFMVDGSIHEIGDAAQIFNYPQKERTREFIAGLSSVTA